MYNQSTVNSSIDANDDAKLNSINVLSQIVEEEVKLRLGVNGAGTSAGRSAHKAKLCAQQKKISLAWENDIRSFKSINNTMNYASQMTSKILETLTNFDTRVESLLKSISDVQERSEQWKKLDTNIKGGLSEVEYTLSKFDSIDRLKNIITKPIYMLDYANEEIIHLSNREGNEATSTNAPVHGKEIQSGVLSNQEKVDLDFYLEAVDSVVELENYFGTRRNYCVAGKALSNLSELKSIGMVKICEHFVNQLISHSIPVEIICGSITDETLSESYSSSYLPSETTHIAIMHRGVDLLKGKGLEPYLTNQNRIEIITQSSILDLQKIIQRLKLNLTLSVPTNSPLFALSLASASSQSSYHSVTFNYSEFCESKRSAFLLQSIENTFSSKYLLNCNQELATKHRKKISGKSNHKRLQSYIERNKFSESLLIDQLSAIYIPGNHPFLQFTKCLLILLISEKSLTQKILPPKQAMKAFVNIIDETLSHFEDISDQLIVQQTKNPNKVYGIGVLLDAYQVLKRLHPMFQELFKSSLAEPEVKFPRASSISNIWKKLNTTISKNFQQFLLEVKLDNNKTLPPDGNVHELTSSTMIYLKHLFDCRDTVVELVQPLLDPLKPNPLENYVTEVISYLIDNLRFKTKNSNQDHNTFNDITLNNQSIMAFYHIFLLNNYHFIWKNSKDHPYHDQVGHDRVAEYLKLVYKQEEAYRLTWDLTLAYLSETQYQQRIKDKMKVVIRNKTKAAIKARFKGFNSEFVALYTEQVQYLIPDAELRGKMRQMIVKLIVPPYQAFLVQYQNSDFTKKPEKYIKFDQQVLETMLNCFFEGSLKRSGKVDQIIESIRQSRDESHVQENS